MEIYVYGTGCGVGKLVGTVLPAERFGRRESPCDFCAPCHFWRFTIG